MRIFYKNYRVIIVLGLIAISLTGCATQGPHFRLDPVLQREIKTFSGTAYIPLIRLCDVYKINWKWDDFVKTVTIEKNGRSIVLRSGSDRILVGGSEERLDRPAMLDNGALFVPFSFARNNLSYLVEIPSVDRIPETGILRKFTIRTIILDAGHGGRDPGAIGKKLRLKEKNLTLAIAKRLKGILEENGINVIMTRDSDTFVSLPKRCEIANRGNADLFVSIHINASRSRKLSGFECYYLSNATDDNARAIEAFENASLKMDEGTILEHSKNLTTTLWDMALTENRMESTELARRICSSVEGGLSVKNKGLKSARFYVLKHTRIPSVLVETAYISNRYEEMKLNDSKFLDKVTDALAQGILAYKKEYEKTEGFTNI